MAAGREFNIGQCGMRAMDSLRIEKSYRMWGQDLTREYTILEAGLGMFAHLDKGNFTGRDALLAQQKNGVPQEFVTLEVDGIKDADPIGNEPIWHGKDMVGRATAGAHGHHIGKTLALGYIKTGAATAAGLELEILGHRHSAKIIPDSPHDPDNARLRG